MKEFDQKALETAIIYVKRLAEGNNPINNQPLEEDTVLNNPNVIRCMYFVKEVLEEVYENNNKAKKSISKSRENAIKTFPEEVLEKFEYREDKGIASLISQIYEPVKGKGYKQVSPVIVNNRLIANGFIAEVYSEEFHKNIKVPSDKGIAIGMRSERLEYPGNSYMSIYYNKQAQEFLVSNFMKLLKGEEVMNL